MTFLTKVGGTPTNSYIRWTKNERIQHWLLATSFILLAITGFALKYSDSWWAGPFSGADWLFNLRGVLHRIAGTIFVLLGIYHGYYVAATRRGRQLLGAFLPGVQDMRDLVHNLLYNLGLKKHPPAFGHFSYMEKAEYLALIWGGIIMGVSGLMLWFEDITLTYFPIWSIDLITVIHLYEAWLATLAIVVWHFYYVIFNPDTYPLNTTMLDGRISEKQLRHEYFLEWQEMQKKTEDDVEPHRSVPDDSH